jgi:hypothetical protein
MPLNIIFNILFGLVELLRMALITSIPCFVLAIVGERVHHWFSKRFSLSWAKSVLISTYLIVTLLIMVLYVVPLYLGFAESSLSGQPVLEELQFTFIDYGMLALLSLVKIVVSSAILSILLLPLLFFASYALEKSREIFEDKIPEIGHKFVAVYATCVLAWLVLLFVFPWAIGGFVYLLYFG